MEIHERLKSVRITAGETQADIAEILGTTRQQIIKYETGKQEMSFMRLKKLCEHWNISADYILDLPKGLPYGKQEP